MRPISVLLTGASGFIGSHLAKDLSLNNFKIVALIRRSSDLSRFYGFRRDNLIFLEVDSSSYKDILRSHQPDVLIHSAWQGVSVDGRSDWSRQVENISFTTRLLELAKELKIKRFISFGSQAEYGNFNGRISEDAPCNPITAYGAAKLATMEVCKAYCELNSINWLWFRLFSVYGTHEGKSWLIPTVITNILKNDQMNLTGCEQRYDYLYTKDLSRAVINVLNTQCESGVFNLSSDSSIRLKDLLNRIKEKLNPEASLNFGALPYRPNQVMHMEGDSSKFKKRFNFKVESNLEFNIAEIIEYYKGITN